jgi:hypothetical protein
LIASGLTYIDEYKAYPPTGRSWKKSLYKRILMLPNRIVVLWEKIAYRQLSIKERVLRSIIDFSSIIKNPQSLKSNCRACNVKGDRSACRFLTRNYKRECKVFPIILKAAIPVGAT